MLINCTPEVGDGLKNLVELGCHPREIDGRGIRHPTPRKHLKGVFKAICQTVVMTTQVWSPPTHPLHDLNLLS